MDTRLEKTTYINVTIITLWKTLYFLSLSCVRSYHETPINPNHLIELDWTDPNGYFENLEQYGAFTLLWLCATIFCSSQGMFIASHYYKSLLLHALENKTNIATEEWTIFQSKTLLELFGKLPFCGPISTYKTISSISFTTFWFAALN